MDLAFSVQEAARVPHAAVPTVSIGVRIDAPAGAEVRSILLDTQVQIAARRRGYPDESHERLAELFGPPGDWGRNLQTLPWARVTTVVPPFTGSAQVEIPLTCTYDLEVAAARYVDALPGGVVPLELIFSGTVFRAGPGGGLMAERIGWEPAAECRLPVALWREALRRHFGDTAWVRVGRDRHDRLAAFKARHRLATWDDAVDALLAAGERAEEGSWTTTP
jgi:Family of unknown function (DUF6084)